jgi:hypothetical protein
VVADVAILPNHSAAADVGKSPNAGGGAYAGSAIDQCEAMDEGTVSSITHARIIEANRGFF